jgi:hypothetical protein
MKFGNEFWLILFREYVSQKLFAVYLHAQRTFPFILNNVAQRRRDGSDFNPGCTVIPAADRCANNFARGLTSYNRDSHLRYMLEKPNQFGC